MFDTHRFVQHLDDRSQAIGGAGGRGQQMTLIGMILIDAIDQIQRAMGGCSNNNLFHALVEIVLQ